MKKLLLITLLLLQTLMAKSPLLQLDTKGHTALIRDIIVTKSGDIISASDDKTIRIWSSQTGKEMGKILGEIGAGSGEIFAIALSPNEKYLAVGGYINSGNNERIRIYNYQTKKLIKVLKSHTNVVNDLSFSPDGAYLISGSGDKTAKIWRVAQEFKLHDTITTHTDDVYGVKILQKANHHYAVTAGDDNKIALYDIEQKKTIISDKSNYNLNYLALNPQKREIAVCGEGREIRIYDYNLHLKKTISSKTEPSGLAYSPNGKFLLAGTEGNPYHNVNIYHTHHYTLKGSFKKHTNLTMAVAFLDNQRAVSGGGKNKEIYIWNINTQKVLKKIVGVGESVWSVGIKGDRIAWGNKWTATKGKSKLQKSINLKSFKISPATRGFKKIDASGLSHSRGGAYGYDAVLTIKKTGAKIVKNATDGYRHNCYGWYRGLVISGGMNGFLKVYDKKGKEVASLIGHTGVVWSIGLDGDRLVSGSSDQTIRVWDLSAIQRGERKIYPLLTVFVANNGEWVVWSKSGYYNASVDGAKYIGYHINQGANKEAYFVSSDKYPALYRPDIIEAILKTGSEAEAIALVSKKRKVQKVNLLKSRPPRLTLLSASTLTTHKDSIHINFSVDSPSEIEKFIVIRNGEKIAQRGLGQVNNGERVTVKLEKGENIISIRAKNRYALSDAIVVNATKTGRGQSDLFKPTLYLLSIGVSNYANSTYNLEVADKDALSVAKMFKAQEGRLYKKVVVKQLINQEATKDNIIDGLEWLEKEATQRDVAIIFVAGHGENDKKNNYYFVSHDGDFKRLRRTSVKWEEIKESIEAIPSKVILFADTCRSGNITGSKRRGDITGAIKSILEAGTGAIIMSATTGTGYSIERTEWGHGAFTKALLEGIEELQADTDNDNIVTIKEIDLYLTQRVKTLTAGEQKPTTKIPESVPDFALGGS